MTTLPRFSGTFLYNLNPLNPQHLAKFKQELMQEAADVLIHSNFDSHGSRTGMMMTSYTSPEKDNRIMDVFRKWNVPSDYTEREWSEHMMCILLDQMQHSHSKTTYLENIEMNMFDANQGQVDSDSSYLDPTPFDEENSSQPVFQYESGLRGLDLHKAKEAVQELASKFYGVYKTPGQTGGRINLPTTPDPQEKRTLTTKEKIIAGTVLLLLSSIALYVMTKKPAEQPKKGGYYA